MRCFALVVLLVGAMWPSLSQAQDEPVPPDAYPAPPAPAPPPAPVPQPQPPPPTYPPPAYPPPGGYQPQPCPPPPPGYPPQPCYQGQPQPYPMMPPQQLVPNRLAQRWAIYGELLGKGLLWGLGMDVNITAWLGLGSTFSYYRLWDSWSAGVVAPYISFYPVGGQRSSLLLQAGPEIFFASTKGPYMWDSGSSAAVFGQATVGYEYRHGFLFRAQLSVLFNQLGAIVWPGFVFGGAF